MTKWNLSQKCKVASTHKINQFNKIKGKNHIIISTDTGKKFDKTQHSFMMKMQNKPEIEGEVSRIMPLH